MKHFEDSGFDLGVDVVVGSLDHFEASLVNPALPRLVRVDDLHMVYGRIESSTILKTSQTFPCRDAGQLVAAQPPLSPPPGRGRQSSFFEICRDLGPPDCQASTPENEAPRDRGFGGREDDTSEATVSWSFIFRGLSYTVRGSQVSETPGHLGTSDCLY